MKKIIKLGLASVAAGLVAGLLRRPRQIEPNDPAPFPAADWDAAE